MEKCIPKIGRNSLNNEENQIISKTGNVVELNEIKVENNSENRLIPVERRIDLPRNKDRNSNINDNSLANINIFYPLTKQHPTYSIYT